MIKWILRKTKFKGFELETQEFLFIMYAKRYVLNFWCHVIQYLIAISPEIFLWLMMELIGEDVMKEMNRDKTIILCICLILHFLFLIGFVIFFIEGLKLLRNSMAMKIYSFLYTKKGKALSKKDFKEIRTKDVFVYDCITTTKCIHCCYGICFNLLKILGKGTLKFVAVKIFLPHEREEDLKDYTMHVLYVNQNWAFDTYCQRQFPIEEILKIYQAKFYKEFSFEDVKDLTYEEFYNLHKRELAKWCEKNQVTEEWSKD